MEASRFSEVFEGMRLPLAAGDEPLVNTVHRSLRDAIIAGRLKPNEKLAQIALAEHLGISRTPIRDALQRLAQEGLVRDVSWRGFVVSAFEAREVLDIYQIRLLLEPLAVEEALRSGFPRVLIAELNDNIDKTRATDEVPLLYELNRQFHQMLVEPCPNRVMVRILDQLWQMPASMRQYYAQTTILWPGANEHRAILAAIEAGKSDRALKLLTVHIRDSQKLTIRALGMDQAAS